MKRENFAELTKMFPFGDFIRFHSSLFDIAKRDDFILVSRQNEKGREDDFCRTCKRKIIPFGGVEKGEIKGNKIAKLHLYILECKLKFIERKK